MIRKKIKYFLILTIIVQTSCRTTKDVTMFQDLNNSEFLFQKLDEPDEYIIRPFDNLYLTVLTLDPDVNKLYNPTLAGSGYNSATEQMYGSPSSQYINGYRVSAEGMINLPIIGDIKVLGMTLDEAEQKVKLKAEEYLQEPTVRVKLLNFRINVLGEVSRPGFFYNYEGNLNIAEAIGAAGGVTKFADLKNVIVNRQVSGATVSHKINLTNNNMNQSEVFFLQPNDLVYIPPTKLKMRSENESSYALVLSTISTLLIILTLIK
ncbi:polysaccharide biosynthesis/export family protein [Draconibacterium orientale]|uniref:polysaccharide biosynthesis/export family protein n=1 Tax=Draconibacterium orientale TaxID=1168034 RepID=UPI002A0A7EEE|nr:polysaccharide biosynthesis/export family protein [Draconibacterium orientale]